MRTSAARGILRRSGGIVGASLWISMAAVSSSTAQVVSDLELERPIGIEDARPTPFRALIVTADFAYNVREAKDDTGPGFSVLFGAARGLELGAALRYVTSPGPNALRGISSGDLQVHATYALASESFRRPALAVRVGVQFPTGLDSRGTDLTLAALLTRSFDAFRLHGNARWARLGDTFGDERADRLEAGVGLDFLPSRHGSTDMILLAGVQARTSPLINGDAVFEAEVGARRRIGANTVCFAGVGSELTGEDDRAKLRLRAGISHWF